MKMPVRKATAPVEEPATQLLARLEAENTALADMRVDVVTASLAEKRRLVELVFSSSAGRADPAVLTSAMLEKLRDAVSRNTTLLEAAIGGQQEVMRVIAGTVQAAGQRSGYAGGGRGLPPLAMTGAALLTNA